MEPRKKYKYKPLSDPAKDIRVARVLPGAYDDEIQIKFRHRPLVITQREKVFRSYLEFEALSYVWGSKTDPSHVRVRSLLSNEGTISITQNLDIALRNLRSRSEPRLLWIDALCINQEDDDEKGPQVAMMASIYSLADNVIAWLGPEDEECKGALDLMRHMAKHVEFDWTTYRLYPSRDTDDPSLADQLKLLPYQSGELHPVCSLLSRAYFQRTWVRQEIILSRHAYVQCGQNTIPWNDFGTFIGCISLKPWYPSAFKTGDRLGGPALFAFRLCNLHTLRLRYANIRINFRNTMCNDHQDRIYAILGLLDPEDRELGIVPDYSRNAEELYIDVARRILEKSHLLELFESCELATKVRDIPSWVPDWSSRLNCYELPRSAWSACAWISAETNIIDNSTIRVAGVEVARIEKITDYKIDEDKWSEDDILGILRQLNPSTEISKDQHSADSWLVKRYCRSFHGDNFAEDFLSPDEGMSEIGDIVRDMEIVWSSEHTTNELPRITSSSLPTYLSGCARQLVGRCFFTATNDYIGLAPVGTQPDDMVCVLLGCKFPVVLRRSVLSGAEQTWQVVGVCQVPGLMHGEAIYRDKLPRHFRPLIDLDAPTDDWIGGYRLVVYDPETQNRHTDPAKLLEEVGVKVESYQRKPHRLDVLPETLREAGVDLVNFTLV